MFKNVSGQKWIVFAFNSTTNEAVTGDAANITAKISIDGAAGVASNDTNPTELEDGKYVFDLTQAETNGDLLSILCESSTSNVVVRGELPSIYTRVIGPTALANMEDMYDGTGYTDDTAPASRDQISNIGAAGGGSINFAPTEDNTAGAIIDGVTFVGSVASGTFADAGPGTNNSISINDTGNDIDYVIGYDVGGGRIATSIFVNADVDGGTDNLDVEVYNHSTSAWDIVDNIDDNEEITIPITSAYTGTGSELGKVYVRFDNNNGTTPSNLEVFTCLVSAVSIGQTIGYANGSVWVDTSLSNTNTEAFVDGVADNPVSTLAAAITIAASVGIKRLTFAAGSSVTLAQDITNYEFMGDNYTLAFGGQIITGAKITGATVSGTFVGTTAILTDCIINAITGPGITMRSCYLNEVTITNNGTAGWYMNDCRSRIAGTGRVVFDFGAAVGDTGLSLRNYSGGIELQNMGQSGTDNASLEGFGNIVINANCIGGTVAKRGIWDFTNNGSGQTILESELIEEVGFILADTSDMQPKLGTPAGASISADIATVDTVVDGIQADLDNGTDGLGAIKTDTAAILVDTADMQPKLGTPAADISADIAAVKVDTAATLVDTNEIQGDLADGGRIDLLIDAIKVVTDALGATAAARLALSAGQMIPFTVDTVTNGHTPTTTVFQADDITEATADHYNGRIVIFTSGALAGQATDITDYEAVGGIGQFTVTATTESPANNDTGIIV